MPILIQVFIFIFLIQTLFFLFAAFYQTDKLTDLSYGLTFILAAAYLLISQKNFFLPQLLLMLMISLWGLRLSIYLFIRILKIKKDKRFDKIRHRFFKFARFWLFQAISVWLISLPTIIVLSSSQKKPLNLLMVLGLFIWLGGLIIETIADYQKFIFKSRPENKNKWIASGLWSLSRHPNYFGEMLCWWGIFIFSLPFLNNWQYLAIISPLFIAFILLFVSGVPPLEKRYQQKYGKNPQYQAYKKRVRLILLWSKKLAS